MDAASPAGRCRAVYVDHDPMVVAHARALLPRPDPSCGYLEADIRGTGKVLAGAAQTLDFGKPVAVILSSVLHLIPDTDDPYGIVRRFTAARRPASAGVGRRRPQTIAPTEEHAARGSPPGAEAPVPSIEPARACGAAGASGDGPGW